MMILDLSGEKKMKMNIGDIVTFQPVAGPYRLGPKESDSAGQTMKVEAIRDTVAQPIKHPRRDVVRSRFLLTCLTPQGEYRSFYHIHAQPVEQA